MNVRNCRNCGKIFNYIAGIPVCPACKESQEARFQTVKAYVLEHKGASINEVATECDVEVAQIRQWLREERLEMTSDSALYLNCESCGTPIRSGRFCDACKSSLTRGFQDTLRANQPVAEKETTKSSTSKMRFL